jgi:hypothetical protein
MTFDVVSFNVVVLMDVPFVMLFECIILNPIVVTKNIEIPEKRRKLIS